MPNTMPIQRATMTADFTDEFLTDQDSDAVRDHLLRALDRWAKERGYIRITDVQPSLYDVTDDGFDKESLRRQHLHRWKIVASYRIMTVQEDRNA